MPKYQVVGVYKVRVDTEVTADSPEQAEMLVEERGPDYNDLLGLEFDAYDVVELESD